MSKSFHEYRTGFMLITLMWFLLLFLKLESILPLMVFVVGINLFNLFISSSNLFQQLKVLNYKANKLVTILFIGILISVISLFYPGQLVLDDNVQSELLIKINQNLILVFGIFAIGGFGSFTHVEKVLSLFNKKEKVIYYILNLVILPSVVVTTLKEIIVLEILLPSTYFLSALLFILISIFILNFNKKHFHLNHISFFYYTIVSLSFYYLFINTMNSLVLYGFLTFNVFLLGVCQRYKNLLNYEDKKSRIFVLILIGGPISPFFFFKTFFLMESINKMNFGVILPFIIFSFMPIFLTPFSFRRRAPLNG
jgi:hypothetical protein